MPHRIPKRRSRQGVYRAQAVAFLRGAARDAAADVARVGPVAAGGAHAGRAPRHARLHLHAGIHRHRRTVRRQDAFRLQSRAVFLVCIHTKTNTHTHTQASKHTHTHPYTKTLKSNIYKKIITSNFR